MSNWKSLNHEEKPAWIFNPKIPVSAQCKWNRQLYCDQWLIACFFFFFRHPGYDVKVNAMYQIQPDDCSSHQTAKNPWNQIFMQHDIDGQKNEDYKISSSLKTIWNDVSDGRSTSSSNNEDFSRSITAKEVTPTVQACSAQHLNNDIPVGNGAQPKSAIQFVPGSDNATGANNSNVYAVKGRAITSRNGSYVTNTNIENGNINQVSSTNW